MTESKGQTSTAGGRVTHTYAGRFNWKTQVWATGSVLSGLAVRSGCMHCNLKLREKPASEVGKRVRAYLHMWTKKPQGTGSTETTGI